MPDILTAGEILVEIMRTADDVPLDVQGCFYGPFPSGAPAIFIDQAANLGHTAGIVGTVGDDEFGRKTLKRLAIDGVDISYTTVDPEYTTAVAFVSYRKDGSRKFLYHIPNAAAGQVRMPPRERLTGVKIFHVMGCSLMISEPVRGIINTIAEVVKSQGGLVSFDPNIRIELLRGDALDAVIGKILSLADVLLPGEKELLQITGKKTAEEARDLLLGKNLSVLVIKQGKHGARFMDAHKDITLPAMRIREVDPTGAGDAFDAGFVCGWIEGLGAEKSLLRANACGALNASYFGPMEGVFEKTYVEYFLKKHGAL
jgi:sugar/nucleoside kinase (ribokinase family)